MVKETEKRSRTVSRRTVLRGAGGVAAGAAVARGRTSALAVPAMQGEEITLTYWHGWTEQWEEMVQYVVDMFHEKQPRIKIEPKVVASDEFLPKLTAAIASGNPPDVVTLFGSTAIPTLADQDAIVPINDLIDMEATTAWVDPNVLKLGQYGDQLYGLSYWAGCYAVLYNKAHFTEVGLDPADGPATIDELDAAAQQLTKRADNGNIDRLGFLPSSDNFWLWGTVFGGNFFDYETQKVTANDPKLVEAMTWYQSFPKEYGADKVAAFNEGLADERAQNLDPFISGKFSMQAQGPWKLGDIRKYTEEGTLDYGVVAPPIAGADGVPSNWTWGDIQIIPKGSKDPAAAAEFVQFTAGVGDPEGYAKRVVWGDRPINIPVSRSVLEVPSFQEVVKNYPGFDVFIDSLLSAKDVGSPPVMPAAAFYNDRLTSTVESVMLLQEEPQEALDKLTEDVQNELD
ncbi:MAG TPA: ABC transporter substrate-binding protein [Thermomicrobiales bacterium]|nr:ABC transporter substrate-binding protein [Thermomicrobiales bacterium]